MTLNIDDVLEVLKIVQECKDTELYIDTGEMQLSIARGKVSGGGANLMNPATGVQDSNAAVEVEAAAATAAPVAAAQDQPKAVDSPAPQADPAPQAVAASATESEEGLLPIKADVTSVFYRRPSPEEPAFIELGDEVKEDTVICLLEVMKCFRQVMAETRGRIAKICVESNSLVEEGTVMFLIRPE